MSVTAGALAHADKSVAPQGHCLTRKHHWNNGRLMAAVVRLATQAVGALAGDQGEGPRSSRLAIAYETHCATVSTMTRFGDAGTPAGRRQPTSSLVNFQVEDEPGKKEGWHSEKCPQQ